MSSSNTRGEYRAISIVLLDGPDFQRLPSAAQHVFLVLKLSLGSTGIDTFPGLVAALAERTGYDEEMVSRQLHILESFRDAATGEADPWIVRERNMVWVVRHLEFEPSLNPEDSKHRKYVRNHVKGLPRLDIVRRFKARYAAWWADAAEDDGIAPLAGFPPSPPEAPSKPLRSPFEAPPEQTSTSTTTSTTTTAKGADAPNSAAPTDDTSPPTKRRSPGKEKGVAAPWLGDLRPIWKAAYGGDLPKGVADLWRDAVEEVGVAEFARRLANYVRQTPAGFTNVGKFAATHGSYTDDAASDDGSAHARHWLALAKRHDLLTYTGNRADYRAKVERAKADPEAPASFDAELWAVRPWDGLGGMEERFVLKAIQERLAGSERRAAA